MGSAFQRRNAEDGAKRRWRSPEPQAEGEPLGRTIPVGISSGRTLKSAVRLPRYDPFDCMDTAELSPRKNAEIAKIIQGELFFVLLVFFCG